VRGNTRGGQDPRPRMGDVLIRASAAPVTYPTQGNPNNPHVVRPDMGKEVVMVDENLGKNSGFEIAGCSKDVEQGVVGSVDLMLEQDAGGGGEITTDKEKGVDLKKKLIICFRCKEKCHVAYECGLRMVNNRKTSILDSSGMENQPLNELIAPLCVTQVVGQGFFLIPDRPYESNARERERERE
jgi:hypothetical protein